MAFGQTNVKKTVVPGIGPASLAGDIGTDKEYLPRFQLHVQGSTFGFNVCPDH
jgi:hypothetical protein